MAWSEQVLQSSCEPWSELTEFQLSRHSWRAVHFPIRIHAEPRNARHAWDCASSGRPAENDLIIALPVLVSTTVTGHLPSFAPNAAVIHADIDPAEIGRTAMPTLPIVGDARG